MLFESENFVKIQDYYINLSNVSSFKISPERLIFNMNYSTQNKSGFISDFIFINDFTMSNVSDIMENKYFKENFIKIFNGNSDVFVNKNSISSYKYEPEKKRYIINFNSVHTYEFSPEKSKVLAEFVYAYEV